MDSGEDSPQRLKPVCGRLLMAGLKSRPFNAEVGHYGE